MLNVRSRTGVVAVTSGAAVLLALPVVASGQVPAVDQVVGEVTQTAGTVVQAPAPAPLPAPAPAARPAPQAAAPAPAEPRSPAPASRATATPSASQAAAGSTSTQAEQPARASAASDRRPARAHSAQSGEPEDEGDIPPAEPTKRERASAASDTGAAANGGNGAADDPSPGRLPFTGFQLALGFLVGFAALTGGAVLRRSVHPSRA